MRKVNVEEPDDQKWKEWRISCETATKQLVQDWADGKPIIITDLYKKMAKSYLKIFKDKCAFCESKIGAVANAHIEHYRPKALIIDIGTRKPVELSPGKQHPGYFWLAYDPDNLLLACPKCNSNFKRNFFPLAEGTHTGPCNSIADEKPLLIHPVREDPEEYIAFNFDQGLLVGKDLRGKTTIEVLSLNRDEVRTKRIKEVQFAKLSYGKVIDNLITSCEKGEPSEYKDIVARTLAGDEEYTGFVTRYLDKINGALLLFLQPSTNLG